ncbi:hypothetical protein DN752_11720 [Echinicola strongylocentroti]|uniref:Uncharacterized protein n=1 Tax=Echinicola strongylocentroti TaxID=1795355 RepID=A0A2Z4IJ45_9BACT|nr:hypothetical protein [Echinicola strongylocentroti]AWW30737.1 hypothetical protein DN752_11720 [Echinicola strongylocentroti]
MKKPVVFLIVLLAIGINSCSDKSTGDGLKQNKNSYVKVDLSEKTNPGELDRTALVGNWEHTGNPFDETDPNKRIKRFELKPDSSAKVSYLDKEVVGRWHWKEVDLSEGTREFKMYISGLILEFSRNGKSKVFFSLKLDTIKVDAPMTLEKGKFKKL